jgi:sugar O-acyltransferase (sialic acid O-acetyltransferase NeuD family)
MRDNATPADQMGAARFVVIGAGGHAKVVIAAIEAAAATVVRVLDDDPACYGRVILGHIVEGPISDELIPAGALVVLGLGSNRARKAVANRLVSAFGTVVHPSAIVHSSVVLGAGSVVFAGAVIQPGTEIGRHVIVNTCASTDHDCVLGDFVHVAPGVRLAGDVKLEEGAFMGIGSCAVPGARVGAWATVGAGGVVLGQIPSGATAAGVPARVISERP